MKFSGLFGRFGKDRSANVAVIFALAAIPLTFFVGMGIDYTLAANRQAQLNAAADAAALSAVTPTMMAQSLAIAKTKAQNTFNAQANAITARLAKIKFERQIAKQSNQQQQEQFEAERKGLAAARKAD